MIKSINLSLGWKLAGMLIPSVTVLVYLAWSTNLLAVLAAIAISVALAVTIRYTEDSSPSEQDELKAADHAGQVKAICRSQAVVEFNMDGTIIHANDNFLSVMGYTLDEIKGQHHSMFVEPTVKESSEYREFWQRLSLGEYEISEYKRLGKGGKEVWIQASYNPILGLDDKPFKIVKYATDITERKLINADFSGQVNAICKSQAVIEFSMDGTITHANDNFLSVMGYTLDEILGQHHSMFVEPEFKESAEYRAFWKQLNQGEYHSDDYKRLGKGGKEVWINASYNPIMDLNNKPFKVVKFAADITDQQVQATRNQRIKQALDNVSSNVMVANASLDIIYMNKAVAKLFNEAESDIRQDLPQFDANQLMGTCIDIFHVNPAHQRGLLANLKGTHAAEMKLGGRTMRITANPVFNEDGSNLGTVVEWVDRTQEYKIQQEVEDVVNGARAGELDKRIALDDKEGFFRTLSEGVNQLVEVADQVIQDTLRVFGAMAEGQLTETMESDYAGSFDQLKQDANATIVKLTEVVSNIQVASNSVKVGADELSQGNADLSQRTEEQASSLEETAASMEEMTSTVKQNADNANKANTLALAARDEADKGGMVVSKAVDAMAEINASSKKISDIISVIDEIAFQTNLLALNASVEAARAGDQGRGFAVVASEVRNLAGRSATAAKEIKELIEDSGRKVDDGSRLVNESGETLKEIVSGVQKVTDIVGEIAAASQEQAAGIDEVNKAILQMDELTQQNAALVEEAAAASQSMGEQADGLNRMIDFFTVDDTASHSTQTESAFTGAENRSGNRPWGKQSAASPTPIAAKKVASGGSDKEWEEF
ncbi:MAG: PAS domain S-box protein [Gammaproteobacteria bacterium]|nr:PAS domain S-box protein [Gammaproteobacteria bacterium]